MGYFYIFAISHLAEYKVSTLILHGEDNGFIRVATVGIDIALLNAVHLLQGYHQAEMDNNLRTRKKSYFYLYNNNNNTYSTTMQFNSSMVSIKNHRNTLIVCYR